jgi:hypothetical protein
MMIDMQSKNGDNRIRPVEDANRSNILFEIGISAGRRIINPKYSG